MRINTAAVATIVFFTLSGAAVAQGAVRGADGGFRQMYQVAGPIGAIVGGAIVGGLAGRFGGDRRQRFHDYVAKQRHDSYVYDRQVDIGAVLPDQGVTFFEIPPDFDARGYKYAIVNDRTVIVDPQSRRIVLIVD